MKKIVFVAISCLFFSMAFSQDAPTHKATTTKSSKINNIAADHFMMQVSSDHWSGMPDSISSHQSGFSRGFNVAFMYNKFLKTNPKLALAGGVGISTSNIFFKEVNIDMTAMSATLPFTDLSSSDHFKKYKMATTYLQIPLEFRYFSKPGEPNKSFKAAIGLKVGTLLNAHTKGKNMEDKNGQVGNQYTQKEASKKFISGSQFMGTARVGYGIFSVFGSYQLNSVLKPGTGPTMHLFQIGLTVSGL
ncbi:MAG TPA: outer membrane beta-barrel protein [Hanamia sp.]